MRSSNQLLKSIGGLLKGESDCTLSGEPIPDWNLVKIVRMNSDADRVRRTIAFLCSVGDVSITMPSAPMPMPEQDTKRLVHPALGTQLAEAKPYYMKGGLIPHLTKKGLFWKSSPPAIHMAVLKYCLYIDPTQSAHLKSVEQIDCGWTAPLPKMSHYDSATGLHCTISSLSALYWVKQDEPQQRQHHWLFLHCWEEAQSNVSLSISNTRPSRKLTILDYGSLLDDSIAGKGAQLALKWTMLGH